jgi:aminoglycoside N3'-acetyltransferase
MTLRGRALHLAAQLRRPSQPPAPVPLAEIGAALQEVGVRPGRDVFIHTSAKAFFHGGPKVRETPFASIAEYAEGIIELILGMIAPGGTLVVGTDSIRGVEGFVYRGDVFDWRTDSSRRGVITELVRIRPDAVRSVHPWYNVTAVGPSAQELVFDHGLSQPYTMDVNSPWFKLMERNGIALFFGVPFRANSYIHLPEYLHPAEYPRPVFYDKPHVFRYVDRDGATSEMPVMLHGIRWADEDVNSFCRYLGKKYGIYRSRHAGTAEIIGFDIRDQYEALMKERDENVCWYDVHYWPERP